MDATIGAVAEQVEEDSFTSAAAEMNVTVCLSIGTAATSLELVVKRRGFIKNKQVF